MFEAIRRLGYKERPSQENQILEHLTDNANNWIPAINFMNMGIMQYNARIWWLRKKWFKIINKTKKVKNKGKIQVHSFYKIEI